MTNVTLEQVLQEVKTLPPDAQRQLRDILDVWLQENSLEERLEQLLYEAGLRSDRRTSLSGSRWDYTPVAIKGKPVSETIIEERR